MKKIYTFLLLAITALGVLSSQAQPCAGNIRTITTDPERINSSNHWDWTTQFFTDAYIKNRPGASTIASPFYNPFSTFQNQNIIFLQNQTVKDLRPTDGWELLVKDFGNGSNLPATAVSNPFFALYNRYSATIRVFFLVTEPITATNNGATVSLQFVGTNASALLAHAEPIMPSISRFKKGATLQVPNRYTNESDFWMFADFPVAYDPCTCLFSSRLLFAFYLIQSTDVDLKIALDGTGYVKQVIKKQPNGGVEVNGDDFPVFSWINGLISSGTKGYNSLSSFQTVASGINGFLNTLNPSSGNNDIQSFSGLMQLGNTLPYLGGMMGVFDFLLAGGRTDAKQAGPAAFEANLDFKLSGSATGTLNLSVPRGDRIIKTPGSLVDGTAAVPVYDNVLGLFALTETPSVSQAIYRNGSASELGGYCRDPNYDPNCNLGYDENGYPLCGTEYFPTSYGTGIQVAQYHLDSDLKYAINPAANLDLTDLKAALVVENNTTSPATVGDVTPFSDPEEMMNRMGYETETDKRFRTPFLPLGCLGSTSVMVFQGSNPPQSYQNNYAYTPAEPTIYVKVRAIFTRRNAPRGTQPVIYLATYKVDVHKANGISGYYDAHYSAQPSTTDACATNYRYPDLFYITLRGAAFPPPLAGIAGQPNPSYPSPCSRVVAPQTAAQLQQFCQNTALYNPAMLSRSASSPGKTDPAASVTSLSCYPNPASGFSTIAYTLDAPAVVRVQLLDNMGKEVQQLLPETEQLPGAHEASFDASKLAPGLYHCVLQTDRQRRTIKVTVAP